MPTAAGRLHGAVRDEFVTRAPSPALARDVALYCGYWQDGIAPAVHRGLPSPYLTVIFTIAHPLTVARHPDPAQSPSQWRTLIGGLHLAPAMIVHDGAQSGIQVMMTPLGARRLLGLPAGALAGLDVEAPDLLGSESAAVSDQLAEARTWPARFAVVDGYLLARAVQSDGRRDVPAQVGAAWDLLRRSGGTAGIAAVADAVGTSPRTLRDGFRSEFGLTPKQAARVIRFDRARRQLAGGAVGGGAARLADLAVQRGYADQAHLTREFAEFAGLPPAAWLREAAGAGDPIHVPAD